MAASRFTFQSFLIRLVFALVLVYASYNPSGYSWFHWAKETLFADSLTITPGFAMATVVLLIGWVVYIRATLRSLGPIGLGLAFAFFGIIVWWLVDIGLIGVDSVSVMTYIVLFLFGAILSTGMSWSHIRRRMSGQLDVDEVDE
jgi:Family of unknown function (DUF6524)